ncbi:MAG: UDP-N-acetylmuramoyl-tripeptide--D-alanyl-D-alanine ligase [Magnetococcales bacterium]|nr:UDP-N-acetylmuramoyl-tripeptide--D-alanyl-D-alanine ligase [Magnetococcales bacterium]
MIFDLDFARKTLKIKPGENSNLTGVSIDTRSIKTGEMFAAIRGPRFDGHDYINKAVAAGCGALLVDTQPEPIPNCPVLVVPDVLSAMEQLATSWRLKVNPVVIAVTGSSGKTTVKELLQLCLKEHFKSVHATRGNLNNHFGLPLTMLNMPSDCQTLVLEMGMSALGEIAHLTNIAKPDIGIVTNVLDAHLAAFNNIDEIAKAKGELFAGLDTNSIAIFKNSAWYSTHLEKYANKSQIITFGQENLPEKKPHIYADNINLTDGNIEASLHWLDQKPIEIKLAGRGAYMVDNVLAAAAACRHVGVTPQEICQGIGKYSPPAGRGETITALGGWQVVDDSYNANPGSVKAAITALASTPKEVRRIVILGDMLELGKQAESLHKELAEEITKARVSHLFTAGPLMKHLFERCKNLSTITAQHRDDPADWLGVIPQQLQPGDRVLVKGSRGMQMERVVKDLISYAL